jgi:hypothetical protein
MLRRTLAGLPPPADVAPSSLSDALKTRLSGPQRNFRGRTPLPVETTLAGGSDMAFEAIKAEIDLLLTQMQNEPEDRHELYLQIVQKLSELKAFGMPLPEELVRLEKNLEAEFASEQVQAERWKSDPSRKRR